MDRQIIFTTHIGSKLHGFATEESDDDIVTVYADPLTKVLSLNGDAPKGKHSHGDNDAIQYELRHFVKLLIKGNPTVWEALLSPKRQKKSNTDYTMVSNSICFIDDVAIYNATRGYVYSTLREAENDSFDAIRRGKKALAALRVLHEGFDMLMQHTFEPHNPHVQRDFALALKAGNEEAIEAAKARIDVLLPSFDAAFQRLGAYITPNEQFINDFLFDVYTYDFAKQQQAYALYQEEVLRSIHEG